MNVTVILSEWECTDRIIRDDISENNMYDSEVQTHWFTKENCLI